MSEKAPNVWAVFIRENGKRLFWCVRQKETSALEEVSHNKCLAGLDPVVVRYIAAPELEALAERWEVEPLGSEYASGYSRGKEDAARELRALLGKE